MRAACGQYDHVVSTGTAGHSRSQPVTAGSHLRAISAELHALEALAGRHPRARLRHLAVRQRRELQPHGRC
eukprot:1357071-Prymnesium_polylepis.1